MYTIASYPEYHLTDRFPPFCTGMLPYSPDILGQGPVRLRSSLSLPPPTHPSPLPGRKQQGGGVLGRHATGQDGGAHTARHTTPDAVSPCSHASYSC
jgi:hypothetical protein